MRKVAIVTGANRGIGFEIVRELAKLEKFDFVYLTGRNEEAGRAAVAKIGSPRVKFFRLDLTEMQTIVDFRNYLAENIQVPQNSWSTLLWTVGHQKYHN